MVTPHFRAGSCNFQAAENELIFEPRELLISRPERLPMYASRRSALQALVLAGAALLPLPATADNYEVVKTDAEWKKILSPDAYDVLRHQGTEPPFSSPLLNEHRKGVFACAGCALPLFSSDTKFESGTGWPSFWKPLPGAIRTSDDRSMFEDRTEVHCRRCGGHLGHVFKDGPLPTGLRYCMDGVALKFIPA
jgi:peptide-methionine (R)-S-oxide reductase